MYEFKPERTLIERGGLWLGYIDDYGLGRLRDLALLMPELFDGFPYALITCVDSGRSAWVPEAWKGFVQDEGTDYAAYRIIGNSILISGQDFRKLVIADNFLGSFDEVWFYREAPDTAPPPTVMLTSEANITDDSHPARQKWQEAIIDWAIASGCLLGLGDGCGINFVTPSRHLAERLINAHSEDAE